jgi:hypothetical protein
MMQPIADSSTYIVTGYFLVDVCNLPEPDCEAMKMVACVPPALVNFEELMPCLIAVEQMSIAQRDHVLTTLKYQRAGEHAHAICAWLDCDLSIDELAVHIARGLSGPGVGGATVLWRYFDPRVFATTMALFSSAQRDALLGPIRRWQFVWCRNWWSITRTASRNASLSDFLTSWPTEQQWPRLLESRVLNRILDKLGEDQTLKPDDCLRYQQIVLQYLADDVLTPYLNEDDLSEFGYLCARYGPAYRLHEKLRPGWEALRRGEMSWTEVRFLLDQSDYAQLDLARDLNKGRSTWR